MFLLFLFFCAFVVCVFVFVALYLGTSPARVVTFLKTAHTNNLANIFTRLSTQTLVI